MGLDATPPLSLLTVNPLPLMSFSPPQSPPTAPHLSLSTANPYPLIPFSHPSSFSSSSSFSPSFLPPPLPHYIFFFLIPVANP